MHSNRSTERLHEFQRANAIGRKIRQHRRAKDMSADDLGDRVGMDRMQVIRMEAGLDSVPEDQLQVIAEVLGVDASDLNPGDAAD